MTTIIIAAVVSIVGLGIGLVIFWNTVHRKKTAENNRTETSPAQGMVFQWKYIAFPLIVFCITALVAIIFLPQLSTDVAYRFDSDGLPESWMNRFGIAILMVGLQLAIVAMVAFIIKGIVGFGQSMQQTGQLTNPEKFMLLIGNIAVLPQIVLTIIMFDIFSYNVIEKHILPLWLIILILSIVGGIILTVFFFKAFMRTRNANG